MISSHHLTKGVGRVAPALLLAAMLAFTGGVRAAALDWKALDLDKNGRFDGKDAARLTEGGVGRTNLDVNGDGRKDRLDGWALPLLLAQWDRTADGQVDASDFSPAKAISLPKADPARVTALAAGLVTAAKVPGGQEDKLVSAWRERHPLQKDDPPAILESGGAAALTVGNLDVARWALAKAVVAAPARASAMNNLAFVLIQDGRHEDAMQLLARALQLEPTACAVKDNLAFVYARRGMTKEARDTYRELTQACPQVAQYHLNYGVALLRAADKAGAAREFASAAKLNPRDGDALVMAVASNPAPEVDLKEVQANYEKERSQFTGEELAGIPPWKELGPEERIDAVLQQASDSAHREGESAKKELADRTIERVKAIAKPVLPKLESACADLTAWDKGWLDAYKAISAVTWAAGIELEELEAQTDRNAASRMLGQDGLVLSIALTAAQDEMAGLKVQAAQRAFEQTVDDLYTKKMRQIQDWARSIKPGPASPFPREAFDYQQAMILAFMVPFTTASPQYVASLDKCPVKLGGSGAPSVPQPSIKKSLGASLGIVGVEYNLDDEEVKLQLGQGVIIAGTWSPKTGFGFQAGVGVDFSEGGFTVSAARYYKFGSDGSLTLDTEFAGGMEAGMKLQTGSSEQVWAATHEPVGSWN